jgi:hypothetical protein
VNRGPIARGGVEGGVTPMDTLSLFLLFHYFSSIYKRESEP